VSYSTDTHVLTIYKNSTEVQHTLSQTRCISLVDDRSKKQALRLIAQMDERQDMVVNTQILTPLRIKGGLRLNIAFLLTPKKDKNGRITDYIGICRDYSELYHIDQRYAEGLAKVQEVENTKTSFVENMVQEIQKPMHTVVDYVSRLHPTTASADEPILTQGILDNADYLLHLIENILFLSRLDAHMVEIKTKETEFAKYFGQQCEEGWAKYRNESTRYIVDNPYEELTLVIDSEHVGLIIRQLTANAAQYTVTGAVRARCEYIGRRLIISVDDTGEGIPQEKLEQLNHSNNASRITTDTKGLGLAICQELLEQMNGNIEFSSEKGSGTTVYVTIPCQATTIKRKR
jgi:signal transduction histidine kinase